MNPATAAVETITPPVPGGKGRGQFQSPDFTPQYHGVGVLYAKDLGDTVEFKVLYLKGTPAEIKDIIVELFGVGALELSGT